MEIKLKFDNEEKLQEFLTKTIDIFDEVGLVMTPLDNATGKAINDWND